MKTGTNQQEKFDLYMNSILPSDHVKKNNVACYRPLPMTKERWDGICLCHDALKRGDTNYIMASPWLAPEIKESWIRCLNSGMNTADGEEIFSLLPEDQFRGTTLLPSMFPMLEDLGTVVATPHRVSIFMEDGYSIYDYEEGEIETFHHADDKFRVIEDEERMSGTAAHCLCRRLNRPIQLQGYEHFYDYWRNVTCTAVPIKNEYCRTNAILNLSYILPDPPWDAKAQKLSSDSFALALAFAASIEKNALQNLCTQPREEKIRFDAAKEIVNDPLLIIDYAGNILDANHEGLRLLHVRGRDQLAQNNISTFLSPHSRLLTVIGKNNTDHFREIFCYHGYEKEYQIKTQIIKKGQQHANEIMLYFTPIKREPVGTSASQSPEMDVTFDSLSGKSPALKNAIDLAKLFASSSGNILLTGESGTGKELFAKAIHHYKNPNRPFVAINCAAIPRDLIESELFGYEAGAFTGADRKGRAGKIELADGGTLFLDEIGDMPYDLQASLLRVLQDKKIMRVGGHVYKTINFDIIAATNQDIQMLMDAHTFRSDLYYRLSVFSISIPPLRDRKGDVELLSKFFIDYYSKKRHMRPLPLSVNALRALNTYQWPGNVRQLENIILYAINLAWNEENNSILLKHLPPIVLDHSAKNGDDDKIKREEPLLGKENDILTLAEAEEIMITRALQRTNFNIPEAAQLLGISKSTMYRKLRGFKIIE